MRVLLKILVWLYNLEVENCNMRNVEKYIWKLPNELPNELGSFEKYLANSNTVMNDAPLTDEEVRNAFYSLKINNSPGYDDVSFNAIKVHI